MTEETIFFDKNGKEVPAIVAEQFAVKAVRTKTDERGRVIERTTFHTDNQNKEALDEDPPTGQPGKFVGDGTEIEWEGDARRKSVPSQGPTP